jgi:hypothetical protein
VRRFNYVEGQSLSVIPPGLQEKWQTKQACLYSIETRYGDSARRTNRQLQSAVLLILRQELDPDKAGVRSASL